MNSVTNKKHDYRRPIRNDAVEVAIFARLFIDKRQYVKQISQESSVSKLMINGLSKNQTLRHPSTVEKDVNLKENQLYFEDDKTAPYYRAS